MPGDVAQFLHDLKRKVHTLLTVKTPNHADQRRKRLYRQSEFLLQCHLVFLADGGIITSILEWDIWIRGRIKHLGVNPVQDTVKDFPVTMEKDLQAAPKFRSQDFRGVSRLDGNHGVGGEKTEGKRQRPRPIGQVGLGDGKSVCRQRFGRVRAHVWEVMQGQH